MQGYVKPTSSREIKINDDSKLEREAHEMGNLALGLSKYPMPMLYALKNLLRSAQYYEKIRRPDPLSTSSKDIIQKYDKEGEFANPDSSVAEDLEAVISNLARSAKKALERYDNDPYTQLRFMTGQLGDDRWATTDVEAWIEEGWHRVAAICHPTDSSYHLGHKLSYDTPIRITIAVDLDQHGTLDYQNGKVLATLAHEITVHAIHYTDWLSKLRSGAYTGEQIRDGWQASHGSGGSFSNNKEHQKFAQGDNHAFNQTAENVYENIPRRQRRSYKKELHQDIDEHIKPGKRSYYPV